MRLKKRYRQCGLMSFKPSNSKHLQSVEMAINKYFTHIFLKDALTAFSWKPN